MLKVKTTYITAALHLTGGGFFRQSTRTDDQRKARLQTKYRVSFVMLL